MGRQSKGYMHSVTTEQYDTLFKLARGEFKVPVKERTRVQNNTRIRFYRNNAKFSVREGDLFYIGKKVIKKGNAYNIVKEQFKKNCGSGYRPIFHQLQKTYANVNETTVKKCLSASQQYQQTFARFSNRSPMIPITAKAVNERWQMDLINMNTNKVQYGGKVYKYIFSVIDVFSRFTMISPLTDKTSSNVKHELSKMFVYYGEPKIIQCDQGCEFKGSVSAFLLKKGIKVIRSRPYHPQSQGKCEVSHVGVRRKIVYKMRQRGGFNWARNIHQIQEAINNTPKEVLSYQKPINVFLHRTSRKIQDKALAASVRCSNRMVSYEAKKKHNSVYKCGENVLIRYPPTGHKTRVPRRRFVLKGIILKRKVLHGLYYIKFNRAGQPEAEWFKVDDITSTTANKEVKRHKTSKKIYQAIQTITHHRKKYLIEKDHNDRIDELQEEHPTIRILLDPKEIGNCQFDSISDQLRRISDISVNKTGHELRNDAVTHMATYAADYRPFIEGSFDEYLNSMKKTSTYGDHCTLQAIAREYNVQVIILSAQGKEYTTLVSNTGLYEADMALLMIGYFPEGQGEHYVSVAIEDDYLEELLPYLTPSDDLQNDENQQVCQVRQSEQNIDRQQDIAQAALVVYTEREYLPREILRKIILICLDNDPSIRFTLKHVNSFFMTIIQKVPLPHFHIGQHVLTTVPYPVSLRRLYMAAGKGSGLAIEIRRAINNERWWNAWLFLRPRDLLRNYELSSIWYRKRN